MWRTAAKRRIVDRLISEGLEIDEVIARLRSHPTLTEADRARAVRHARARAADEEVRRQRVASARASRVRNLQAESWRIASTAGRERASYEDARRAIVQAVESAPDDRRAWNTLGVVLYRLERHDEALAAFAEAERLNALTP